MLSRRLGFFAAYLSCLILPISQIYAAGPISNISIQSSGGFSAGDQYDSVGSPFFFVVITSADSEPPSTGQRVTFQLIDNGEIIDDSVIFSGTQSNYLDIVSEDTSLNGGYPSATTQYFTFFRSGSNLTLRATADNGVTTSANISVAPGAPAKIIVVGNGETYYPGTNPAATGSTGKRGTPSPLEPNQPSTVRVILTDAQFNTVSAGNFVNVNFVPQGSFLTVPSGNQLVSPSGTFFVTITQPQQSQSFTVVDVLSSAQSGNLTVTSIGPPAKEIFAYPSPFNPRSDEYISFRYRVSGQENITVKVVDIFGQHVWQDTTGRTPGTYSVSWNGKNDKGEYAAAGIYYVLLEEGGALKSKKQFGIVK